MTAGGAIDEYLPRGGRGGSSCDENLPRGGKGGDENLPRGGKCGGRAGPRAADGGQADQRRTGWAGGQPAAATALRKARRRRELSTTKTLEKAIAAPASIGVSSPSAATGIAATL